MKKTMLFASLLSLSCGTLIYMLFRTSTLKLFSWLNSLNINFQNSGIRKFAFSNKEKIPDWFLFSLPDGLWIFSYVCLMIYIWNFKTNFQCLFWIFIIPLIAITSEIGQALKIVPGTFDTVDLFFYLLGLTIPILLIIKNNQIKQLEL